MMVASELMPQMMLVLAEMNGWWARLAVETIKSPWVNVNTRVSGSKAMDEFWVGVVSVVEVVLVGLVARV